MGGKYSVVRRDRDYICLDQPDNRGLFSCHRQMAREGDRGWGSRKQWIGKWIAGFREAVQRSGLDIYMGST